MFMSKPHVLVHTDMVKGTDTETDMDTVMDTDIDTPMDIDTDIAISMYMDTGH
jgi:hypothetical protein